MRHFGLISIFIALTISACMQEIGVAENSYKWPSFEKETTLAPDLIAKNYYVVLDGSGSMDSSSCTNNSKRIIAAKKALVQFAGSVPSNANLGFMAFDSRGITERVPLGLNNRGQFIEHVSKTFADSGTPLFSAIKLGFRKLEEQARKQQAYGEYHLVIVTDGEASPGESPDKIINFIVNNTPVVIHTIGFCIGSGHSLNQPGNTIYKSANNPAELVKGLKEVLAESETFDATW